MMLSRPSNLRRDERMDSEFPMLMSKKYLKTVKVTIKLKMVQLAKTLLFAFLVYFESSLVGLF